uniref:Uncharacterized protein n=1 Tax=Timema shepardi TaxID=629360 RepID=A0A7R9AXR7_TIMSH|nr:unnamed protein product [Timema shepardi]
MNSDVYMSVDQELATCDVLCVEEICSELGSGSYLEEGQDSGEDDDEAWWLQTGKTWKSNVPCPIVYGAVVDSACLVWETTCGERGACWLYDANVFRMFFHGTTGAILLCAFFVDIIVWYKAGSINFVDEQVPIQEEELDPIASKTRSETSV